MTDGDSGPAGVAAGSRVVISYAHESPDHRSQVGRLGRLLRGRGIDAVWDDYLVDLEPVRQSWPVRMRNEMHQADYVLVIASQHYRRVTDGDRSLPGRRGLAAEAEFLEEMVNADRHVWQRKILPVLLPGHGEEHIPVFLSPSSRDHFRIPELTADGVAELCRYLQHPQPERQDGTPSAGPWATEPPPAWWRRTRLWAASGLVAVLIMLPVLLWISRPARHTAPPPRSLPVTAPAGTPTGLAQPCGPTQPQSTGPQIYVQIMPYSQYVLTGAGWRQGTQIDVAVDGGHFSGHPPSVGPDGRFSYLLNDYEYLRSGRLAAGCHMLRVEGVQTTWRLFQTFRVTGVSPTTTAPDRPGVATRTVTLRPGDELDIDSLTSGTGFLKGADLSVYTRSKDDEPFTLNELSGVRMAVAERPADSDACRGRVAGREDQQVSLGQRADRDLPPARYLCVQTSDGAIAYMSVRIATMSLPGEMEATLTVWH